MVHRVQRPPEATTFPFARVGLGLGLGLGPPEATVLPFARVPLT